MGRDGLVPVGRRRPAIEKTCLTIKAGYWVLIKSKPLPEEGREKILQLKSRNHLGALSEDAQDAHPEGNF